MKLNIGPAVRDELEQRKQVLRDLWSGKPLSRVPVEMRFVPPKAYTTRQIVQDGDKQLETELTRVQEDLRYLKFTDTIPSMRPDVGCSCIASAFGAEYYWGETEAATPGIKQHLLRDVETEVEALQEPPVTAGWLGEGLDRIRRFAEAGDGVIPIALLDTAGGVNVAADLLGTTVLMESFYTAPESVTLLLEKIQRFYLKVLEQSVKAAGGEQHITTTDFVDFWFPEGHKGHISDDMCAMFGPAIYQEFSAPFHEMVYRQYGCGGLHNCGPNPCAAEYVAGKYSPRCMDLADTYSHGDLPNLKKAFRRKAFIYLYWDGVSEPVQWYRDIVELMDGEVLVVPSFTFSSGDIDPEPMYRRLSAVATEQAARMKWGFETR